MIYSRYLDFIALLPGYDGSRNIPTTGLPAKIRKVLADLPELRTAMEKALEYIANYVPSVLYVLHRLSLVGVLCALQTELICGFNIYGLQGLQMLPVVFFICYFGYYQPNCYYRKIGASRMYRRYISRQSMSEGAVHRGERLTCLNWHDGTRISDPKKLQVDAYQREAEDRRRQRQPGPKMAGFQARTMGDSAWYPSRLPFMLLRNKDKK